MEGYGSPKTCISLLDNINIQVNELYPVKAKTSASPWRLSAWKQKDNSRKSSILAISESERIQRKSEWFDDEGLKLETSALKTLYGSQFTLPIAGSAALST